MSMNRRGTWEMRHPVLFLAGVFFTFFLVAPFVLYFVQLIRLSSPIYLTFR